ncbi:MAG: lytic murein transglycosylase B [Gammaproteobacteria bacterium]|nr:lytic murein transglycosylase B [Gammaproteobacteria bacterium]
MMVKKHGFKSKFLTQLFTTVKPRPQILSKMKYPLERKPWSLYRKLYVSELRIAKGLAFWQAHAATLARAEARYGVPANIIVATIGVESKYGETVGKYCVLDALVNLAFAPEGKRRTFFRNELEAFLLLAREQNLSPETILGSYAGAIGQPQFMPSSFRHYAVNFSGHTKIDLTNNVDDVIGSVANYYHQNGWEKNQPIAMPISMRGGKYQLGLTKPKSISLFEMLESAALQMTVPPTRDPRFIILQTNYGNEYWHGFYNFDVIKRYNHSELYAMAIFQLSHYLAVERERVSS